MDWNLLHLTSPIAVWQAAREWHVLPEMLPFLTANFHVLVFNTSEIVEPSACFFSSFPLQTVWIVTATPMLPYPAPITGAPCQISSCICGY